MRMMVGEKGLGLSSVRNRVVMLGGTIEILSSPGEGVSIFILIPIQSHERK
jgi:signal transduction histidine kinase